MESDRPQHERPAAYVIAQQYSSAKFCLNAFLFPQGKKKFDARFKMLLLQVLFSVFFFWKSLKPEIW